MSRIGNSPITVPDGVDVKIKDNSVTVKGKLGTLEQSFDSVQVFMDKNILTVKRSSNSKEHKSKHGLYRSLINNMVIGVTDGFLRELELVGVGYRASNNGQVLDLNLGFSHNILLQLPNEIKVQTISDKGKNPIIKLSSYDKQLLGHVVAKIRSFRKPEPYKGKGIRFVGEVIRRKAGKSA